jgi:hypothetical protein
MKTWGIVVLAAFLTITAAMPASATEGVLKDPRGDRPAPMDWTRVIAENTSTKVKVRINFVNLPTHGLQDPRLGELDFYATAVIESYDVADWRHYFVSAYRGANGKTKTTVVYNDASGYTRVRCANLKVRWVSGKGGYVEMVVPRSCLEVSRTIAVSAAAGSPVANRLYDESTKRALVGVD